jgi:hypothetical protein
VGVQVRGDGQEVQRHPEGVGGFPARDWQHLNREDQKSGGWGQTFFDGVIITSAAVLDIVHFSRIMDGSYALPGGHIRSSFLLIDG